MTAEVIDLGAARDETRTARLAAASFELRDPDPRVAAAQDARDVAAARDNHGLAEQLADLVDSLRGAQPADAGPEA